MSVTAQRPDIVANARGIPRAPFIEDIELYIGAEDADAAPALNTLQEMLQKYRYMESTTAQRLKTLEAKVPELEETLQILKLLKEAQTEQRTMQTSFELSDTLYCDAVIEPVKEVNLWLGANVMLSYPLAEAEELLQEKHDDAEQSLANAKEDLSWLSDQITTTEVNIARVYNFDVKRRKQKREAEANGR